MYGLQSPWISNHSENKQLSSLYKCVVTTNNVYCIWISARRSGWDGGHGSLLCLASSSFRLLHSGGEARKNEVHVWFAVAVAFAGFVWEFGMW